MKTTGCVLDWRGGTRDWSRYHHSITNNNAVPVRGVNGYGMKFNGTTAHLDCGSSSILHNFTSKSVFAWLKPSAFIAAYRVIWAAGFWTAPYGDICYCNNGSNGITIALKNTFGSDIGLYTTFTPDEWIHIGYTWDGTNAYLYKNGIQVDSGVMSGSFGCTSTNFFIGSRDGTQDYHDSIISSVQAYNRALTPLEIWNNYVTMKPYVPLSESPVAIV